jgi:polygalacturonase
MTRLLNILDFGAVGDGVTNNQRAIQEAFNQARTLGATVVIPQGTFLSGSIQVFENTSLHLDGAAILLASGDYSDYLPEHEIDAITSGLVVETVLPKRGFIVGYQAHGFGISGTGVISGNADAFIEQVGEHIHQMRAPIGGRSQYLERPFTIFLIDSERISFRDFTLSDPAFWAIRLTGCDNLVISGISILTDLKVPNADGIDIDRCENVRITNCLLITADDCVSLKTCSETSMFGEIRDVVIADCILQSTSGAITLGTESCSDIERVVISNIVVKDSHRGIAIRPREGGTVRDVVVSDCIVQTRAYSESWWGHGEPLHVTAAAWNEPYDTTGNPERRLVGKVSNIRFDSILCRSEAGILVWGQSLGLIQSVTFRNVQISLIESSQFPHRTDLRPAGDTTFLHTPHSAFELTNATGVSLQDCEVVWQSSTQNRYDKAIAEKDLVDFSLVNLRETQVDSNP